MKALGKYFQKAISDLRTRLEESQEGMARRLGCSLRTYVRWEYGTAVPQAKYLKKLALMAPDLFPMVELEPEDKAEAELALAYNTILAGLKNLRDRAIDGSKEAGQQLHEISERIQKAAKRFGSK